MSKYNEKPFYEKVKELFEKQDELFNRKNESIEEDHGIYKRYKYPVLTRKHIPVSWRFDLNYNTNPYLLERLGVNSVFNSGAIELEGKILLVVRVEGGDRGSDE